MSRKLCRHVCVIYKRYVTCFSRVDLYRPYVTLVRRILALQIPGTHGFVCRLFATELHGRAIGRHAVLHETLLRPTLYSLYRCWQTGAFRWIPRVPRAPAQCNLLQLCKSNVRVRLHLYLHSIVHRDNYNAARVQPRPSTLIRSVSRIAIQTRPGLQ